MTIIQSKHVCCVYSLEVCAEILQIATHNLAMTDVKYNGCLALCRVAKDIWTMGFSSNTTTTVPPERWDSDGAITANLFAGNGPSRFGVFLPMDTAFMFDATAFGISDQEALLMDAQQRLLLESAAECLHTSDCLQNSTDCGVFVGISSMDYQKLASRYAGGISSYSATGITLSVAAGRLSYSFGLQGPALSIDTACSSSLVATHTAAMSMSNGRCQCAGVAGANLMLWPDTSAMFKTAGMLADDGHCKVMDAAADGYVRAEAVAVMVLEGVEGCDPQHALAIISATAVNQDGRSSSLTAPNGPAQQAVIQSALTHAGLSPDMMTAISIHGTGTGLGGCMVMLMKQYTLLPRSMLCAPQRNCYTEISSSQAGHCVENHYMAVCACCLRT